MNDNSLVLVPLEAPLSRWHRLTPEQKARHRENCRAYRKRNPGKDRETYLRFRAAHPEWRKEDYKRHRAANLARARMNKYGLTPDALAALLAGQNGVCAICRTVLNSTSKPTTPHVDHDHKTGAIRGLLCSHCNTGIGALRDDAANVMAAYRYLTGRHGD